jgi:hypothetical protein
MDIYSYLIQMDPATHVATKHITVVSTLYYTYIILIKPVKFYTIDTATYVRLLWPNLLSYVSKKWCMLPEDGEIIGPKM